MNRKRRTVFGVALLLMVVMGLYPPWVVSYSYPSGSVAYPAGYSWFVVFRPIVERRRNIRGGFPRARD